LSPEEISVRGACESDLAAVAEIQTACPEAAHWNVRDYLAHHFLVAVCGGRVAGFAVARRLTEGETELLNLAVHPAFRRRGAGRRLFAAITSGYAGALWLEVRESNAGARKFYKSLGLTESGRRPEYYRGSGEAAIVMNFHS
jgi:ribosomal-protein-alanine N-acetyltransferase